MIGSMPGALDQISWFVIGYGVLVTLLTAYCALRWRQRPPWLDSMAWMLEVLLVIRGLAGLAALPGDDVSSTHVGYLIATVCVLPIALRAIADDRGPWSLGVLGVSVVAVAVMSARVMVTL